MNRVSAWLGRSIVALAIGHTASAARAEAAHAPTGAAPPPAGPTLAEQAYAAFDAGDMKSAARQFLAALEAGGLTPEQTRTASLGLSDALMSLGNAREAEQALALIGPDDSYEVLSRRAFALDAAQDRAGAMRAYAAAATVAATPAQRTMMTKGLAFAAATAGDRSRAATALAALEGDPNLSRTDTVNLAYVALKFQDDRRAQILFGAADRLEPLDGMSALDAGYSAKRAGAEAVAVRYFRQGLASAVFASQPAAVRDPIRREVADLSRRWGVNASVFYDDNNTRGGRIPGAGQGNLQVGGEVYLRPLGWNGGQPVEVFVRAFQTLDSRSGDATGAKTLQAWVGVRGKPIVTQNLVVEASRLVKVGSRSRNDWMARASYSTTRGLEVRSGPGTPMFHVFADGARLFRSEQTLGLVDARVGRSFHFDGGRLIVAPFVGAVGSYDNKLVRKSAFSAGPGLWTRRWFREDVFRAPQSYADLSLQYRLKVAGDRRGEGLFASFSVSY